MGATNRFNLQISAFGTGYGSFIHVEQMVRLQNLPGMTVDYAHNEYLEAFVEGGLIRFY